MKIAIVGCGRVGASAAELWDATGHEVIILDISTSAFDRLPSTFRGTAVLFSRLTRTFPFASSSTQSSTSWVSSISNRS